jgi:hypothetical protein
MVLKRNDKRAAARPTAGIRSVAKATARRRWHTVVAPDAFPASWIKVPSKWLRCCLKLDVRTPGRVAAPQQERNWSQRGAGDNPEVIASG